MPINERKTSDIFISEQLRDLLGIFSDQSDVAKLLLYRRLNKELLQDSHINYIGVSSDPTKISYLTQDRIDAIINAGEQAKLSNEEIIDEFWKTSKRFSCKPGAFVSKIFKDISAKEVENFATLYKTFVIKKDVEFSIVSGKDIYKYYDESSYSRQSGTLGQSCMKSSGCQKFFDFYVDNDIKMLVLTTPDNKLLGRALVWEIDVINEEGNAEVLKLVDRVYTVRDEDYFALFTKWANDNGYLIKSYHNWCSTLQFDKSDEENEYELEYQLKKWDHKSFPYLDTFKWLDLESGILTNYKPHYFNETNSNYRCLVLADGRTEQGNFLSLDEVERDFAYTVDIVQADGVNTTTGHCVWSDTFNGWILRENSTYSEELEDYVYKDMSMVSPDLIRKRLQYVRKARGKSTLKDHIDEIFDKIVGSLS